MTRLHICIAVALLLSACSNFKHPGGGANSMSAYTLCYRYAYAKSEPAVEAEIKSRDLDCAEILQSRTY